MISCKLLCLFLLILSTFPVDYAAALKLEEIVGGYPALRSDFKYHAAIVGKYNYSKVASLLCSAAIISDYLLVSAARCFVHSPDKLKKIAFFAAVGEDMLLYNHINLKEIENIYTRRYTNYGNKHDLAISSLKESLNLQNCNDLIALEIPNIEENFDGKIGTVSGFGISLINDIKKYQSQGQIPMAGRPDLSLKQANVTIITTRESFEFENYTINLSELFCKMPIVHFTDVCGIIEPDEIYNVRGVCMGDNGAPLVIANKIIGIVSRHQKNCDDTIYGTIYTKISKFKKFIDGLLKGSPISGTNVYPNPPYVPGLRASKTRNFRYA